MTNEIDVSGAIRRQRLPHKRVVRVRSVHGRREALEHIDPAVPVERGSQDLDRPRLRHERRAQPACLPELPVLRAKDPDIPVALQRNAKGGPVMGERRCLDVERLLRRPKGILRRGRVELRPVQLLERTADKKSEQLA